MSNFSFTFFLSEPGKLLYLFLSFSSFKYSLTLFLKSFKKSLLSNIYLNISNSVGISLSTFNYDEIAKSNKYILTLPTNRKEIVKEKFILAIGATILGGLLGLFLTIIVVNVLNSIRPDNVINLDYESLIATTIGGMWGISLIQAIQIPSIFKWGAEKGRIQMSVLLFVIVAVVAGIAFLIMQTNFHIDVEMLKNVIHQFGFIILVLTMVIMYYISYKISYKIYRNKEE